MASVDRDRSIEAAIGNLSVWEREGHRAPHKPLLVLFMIARALRGRVEPIGFRELETEFRPILREFGPPGGMAEVQLPFWYLQSDGIWEVSGYESAPRRVGRQIPTVHGFRKANARGGFTADVLSFLQRNPDRIMPMVQQLLESHFPETLHDDILASVGLQPLWSIRRVRARDPEFRDRVLRAYEYRCAVCGFDVKLDGRSVALEAAHIRWHMAGGPDREENGLALCTMHHKLFDKGVYTFTPTLRLLVSDRAHGTSGFHEWLMRFHSKELLKPQRQSYYPQPDYLAWHVAEVFQGVSRQTVEA